MNGDLEPRDADEAALIGLVHKHDEADHAADVAHYARDEQVVAMLHKGASATRLGRLVHVDQSQIHRIRREWPSRTRPA